MMMTRPLAPGIAGAVVAAVVAAVAPIAHAKTTSTVAYRYEQVWPAAVRFLRIDEGLTIVEKDAEAGYILFELTEDKRTFRGSMEVARVKDGGQAGSRLVVHIADRPAYMEQGILTRFEAKLRDELGEPEPPPADPPAKPAPAKRPAGKPAPAPTTPR
jgi:hypothetical protein